jgi:nicotinamidase-related amidase
MGAALLVIDVQQALCAGQWAAYDIDNVIARINAVSAQARVAGIPVVLVQHEAREGPLVRETPGWQLDGRLATAPADLPLAKTACDAFHRTELDAMLRAKGVDRVIVCGLQSEFCVDSTVRGALARGYPVTLVADGHSTLDNGVLTAAQISAHHTATLANVDSYGPRVTAMPAAEVRP